MYKIIIKRAASLHNDNQYMILHQRTILISFLTSSHLPTEFLNYKSFYRDSEPSKYQIYSHNGHPTELYSTLLSKNYLCPAIYAIPFNI